MDFSFLNQNAIITFLSIYNTNTIFDVASHHCLFLFKSRGYMFHISHTNSYLYLIQTFSLCMLIYVFTKLLPAANNKHKGR